MRPITPLLSTLPRGAITELSGAASSGRTAVVHSLLAAATIAGEVAALVDADDSFDPGGAQELGVDLGKLLWVRCGRVLEHALKAADILLHGGGFGLVVLDVAGIAPKEFHRVPVSYWYRARRAVEHTPAALVVAAQQPQVRQCATRQIEMRRREVIWTGQSPFELLEGAAYEVVVRKPLTVSQPVILRAAA